MKSPIPENDQTLFLISEELKSRKIFYAFSKIGLHCGYLPCLDELILKNIGLDSNNDDALDAYHKILDKRSKKIKPDPDSIAKQAAKAYQELKQEKIKQCHH